LGVPDDKRRLVDLIRAHADGRGAAVAIEHGAHEVTYRELGLLIDRRARELSGRGATRGSFVAIERGKSIDFVVDYLAVLALGGTVIPLDPDTPAERRATFRGLSRPDLLIRDSVVVDLGGDPSRRVGDDAAFIYFTSGSTGVPKPVLGSASALRSFVEWFGPEFRIGGADRFAFSSGLSFEASLRDIFPPLTAGATLVVPADDGGAAPDQVVDWLARQDISVVTVVPSVARAWLRDGRAVCPAVRAVFFLGEPLTPDVLAGWPVLFPGTAVRVNSYGSTESGQATIYKRIPPRTPYADRVPAGRPVPGTRYCFVEPTARLTPGVVRDRLDRPADGGEIVIVSRACSHGYLGMPQENAARFADLGGGVTAYRTGDLGRVDADGDLVVVGRADDEVKINGVRVHPAEVTRAIRGHPTVRDAFVVATAGAGGAEEARLTAYVVAVAGEALSFPKLRRDLMDVLPLAMIPARFAAVDALPTLRTGKVDRAALARMADGSGGPAFVAPSGDIECWLADQFGDLFGVERVSAADDFFALGGDSIAAARLAARISRDLGTDVSQRAVFAGVTVAGIAEAILDEQLLSADPEELRALLDALEGAG
jgi:amino acid adenylation domain-containing protein